MHDGNPRAKFSRSLFAFAICFFRWKKINVKFYYCDSTEWFISVDRLQETEKNETFPASVGHTCLGLKKTWPTPLAYLLA